MGAKQWVALAEVVLANLVWIGELDVEGWVVATAAACVIGVVIWVFVGPLWLVLAASLYLAFLVCVRLAVDRADRSRTARRR